MSSVIQKGQTAPLQYSKQGRQRITVGISWDTPEIMPERPEAFVSDLDEGTSNYDVEMDVTVGFVQETYDLDLICLIFNEELELIDAVSPSPEENVDLSGAIYHSGDDTAGVSSGDDEQVSVELANLPDNIHHLVFISVIQSNKHTFADVLNTSCRVADGKTNQDMLKFNLGHDGHSGADQTACIMLSIYKDPDGIWHMKNVSEFRIDKDIENWGEEVQRSVFAKDL